jgi:Amt family ammonium transporter
MLLVSSVVVVVAAALVAMGRELGPTLPQSIAGLNPVDIAWVSISAGLVMLMTPALGFFYGGLVRQKNLVSTVVQCFTIFAVACVVWTLWGYTLAFSPSAGGFGIVGGLKHLFLRGVGLAPDPSYATTIPALSFYFFQMKFAAITPALIVGAIAERIRFRSVLVFIIIWATVVYAPVAHWVWGEGGWLRQLGTLDFAGGIVVHLLAGVSALAAALVVGRRRVTSPDEPSGPANVPFVILGAALLWFGWFGFNAGSALAMNGIAVNALVTTNTAACFACVAWMLVDWYLIGKPTATGAAVGAICGLGAITPASGFVNIYAAMVIGLVAGVVCNFVMVLMKRGPLDDTLDVFACHGVGGCWGSLATGLFAEKVMNPAGNNGLFYGNPHQFLVQLVAVITAAAWGFLLTVGVLKIIDRVMGLRVTAEEEEQGLDMTQHGEQAYAGLVWYVPSVVPPKESEEPIRPQEVRYTYQRKGPGRR